MPDPENLKIDREEGDAKGRYSVQLDGVEAEMTYSRAGASLIIIDHTEVPDALRAARWARHWCAGRSRMHARRDA